MKKDFFKDNKKNDNELNISAASSSLIDLDFNDTSEEEIYEGDLAGIISSKYSGEHENKVRPFIPKRQATIGRDTYQPYNGTPIREIKEITFDKNEALRLMASGKSAADIKVILKVSKPIDKFYRNFDGIIGNVFVYSSMFRNADDLNSFIDKHNITPSYLVINENNDTARAKYNSLEKVGSLKSINWDNVYSDTLNKHGNLFNEDIKNKIAGIKNKVAACKAITKTAMKILAKSKDEDRALYTMNFPTNGKWDTVNTNFANSEYSRQLEEKYQNANLEVEMQKALNGGTKEVRQAFVDWVHLEPNKLMIEGILRKAFNKKVSASEYNIDPLLGYFYVESDNNPNNCNKIQSSLRRNKTANFVLGVECANGQCTHRYSKNCKLLGLKTFAKFSPTVEDLKVVLKEAILSKKMDTVTANKVAGFIKEFHKKNASKEDTIRRAMQIIANRLDNEPSRKAEQNFQDEAMNIFK
ncbi:MAG: hypothetical protein WC783_00920 [Candidatus Paceibacterota bacterium]|jgi:hypothetical protein